MPKISVVNKRFHRLVELDQIARVRAEGARKLLDECVGDNNKNC
jgi:hypothetical protein